MVKRKMSEAHHCDLCGIPLYQLQGPDFCLGVCFNPNHEKPRFGRFPWCGTPTFETRNLKDWEIKEIRKRKKALMRRLKVTRDFWELISVVRCFDGGGWIPKVDERITKKKGHHL
jgi:hypothetical protein